jgi:uncharacterized protein YqjF (DUF2071 family)
MLERWAAEPSFFPEVHIARPVPVRRPFLTAEWRHLLMLNYEVDPALLRPLVPAGTELDFWQGRALISIVAFRFLDTRLWGVPIPLHRNFDEINLRSYVRRRSEGTWRRAVVFIREAVPRLAIAAVARLAYNEPYVALPMRHEIRMAGARSGEPGLVRYQWKQGRWYTAAAQTVGPAQRLGAGSEEEFITEHYWGYTSQRDGGCLEYQVEHPRWRIWQVSESRLDCDVERMYGGEYAEALRGRPCSAFVAEGSPIAVYRGVRLAREERSSVHLV